MEEKAARRRPGHMNLDHDGMFVESDEIQVAFRNGTLAVDQYEGFAYQAHGVIPANCWVSVSEDGIVVDGRHVRRMGDPGPIHSGFAGRVCIPIADRVGRNAVVAYLAQHGFAVKE